MRDKITQATAEFDKFQRERLVDHWEKGVELLEEVEILSIRDLAQRQAGRRELLEAWCRTLAMVDSVKDPKFDPDDAPLLNIAPPDSTTKEARLRHEADVAANDAKKASRRMQFAASQIEERAVESAQRLIAKLYTKSAPDVHEVKAALAAAKLSQARQKQLLTQ